MEWGVRPQRELVLQRPDLEGLIRFQLLHLLDLRYRHYQCLSLPRGYFLCRDVPLWGFLDLPLLAFRALPVQGCRDLLGRVFRHLVGRVFRDMVVRVFRDMPARLFRYLVARLLPNLPVRDLVDRAIWDLQTPLLEDMLFRDRLPSCRCPTRRVVRCMQKGEFPGEALPARQTLLVGD